MCMVLFFLCFIALPEISAQINLKCEPYDEFPDPRSDEAPSKVAAVNVIQVENQEHDVLNISWAINIDASIDKLQRTVIESPSGPVSCSYSPSIAKTDLTGLEQIWFYYLLSVTPGLETIVVYNLPLALSGHGLYKTASVWVEEKTVRTTPLVTTAVASALPVDLTKPEPERTNILIIFLGVTAALMALSFCFVISHFCGPKIAAAFGLDRHFPLPVTPVPVLIVYPAENSAFQLVIVELAEFLHCHGGCKVAIDVWQQEKIAEQGPMRWLVEQVQAADCVLIVSPQAKNTSAELIFSNPQNSLPEMPIPAAAHDLYPLILNMVASQAKNASQLSKFWVLQLNKKKRSNELPLQLRTCTTFCLMKDLNKLCKKIHGQTSDRNKLFNLQFRQRVYYSENSTVKLGHAIERHRSKQPSKSKENYLLTPEGSPV